MSLTTRDNLFDTLDVAVKDPATGDQIVGLLRALSRPLLQAVDARRSDEIKPFENELLFLARTLRAETDEDNLESNTEYLLGRVESFIDLCSAAIDRSLSERELQEAKRLHARKILEYLLRHGETAQEDLRKQLGIEQTHLSNILRRMEEYDLVRRRDCGRYRPVSIGPKGEAAYGALETNSIEAPSTLELSHVLPQVPELEAAYAWSSHGLWDAE